jgi:hypothetical protein
MTTFRALLVVKLALFVVVTTAWQPAVAACSSERIKRMSQRGSTVTAIARTCKMDKEEVQSILDEDGEGEDAEGTESEGKLPSGAPVGQCGCWGPAHPSHRQPHVSCKSGYARPNMCPAMCPAGGYAWRGVCT